MADMQPYEPHDPAVPDRGAVLDTSFEVALDPEPEPTRAPVYVDVVAKPTLTDLPPIIPAWMRSRESFTAGIRYRAHRSAYLAGLLAAESVRRWWWQTLVWSIVGVFRLAGRQIAWWWLLESHGLRQEAATNGDAFTYLKLHRETKNTRAWRGIVLLGELLALVVLAAVVHWGPWWVAAIVAAVAVPYLAHIGRPPGQPIIRPLLVKPRFRKLRGDIVLRAYYAAKLGDPDKRDQDIDFGSPMARDPLETGSQIVVHLPYGKTFADAVKAKPAIASGLDVTEQQVYLTRDKTSTRSHLLYVADRDPLAIPAGRTPLLDGKPRDIWKPAPIGLDERGRRVELLLMWISVLIGAQPRKGKTFAARLLALYAALDPYVRLLIVDGKMSADWDKFRMVAHRYVCGVVPNSRDNDPIEHFLDMLREVKRHIEQVNEFLAKLPTDECPEGKITRDLSRKYAQLRVWMLVMEEFQNYYETDDQDTNKEIAGLLSFIKAVGPSAGVIILSASQKPSGVGAGDVARLFNRYRDNHDVRFALKCGNRIVSEAILGGDAYSEGFDASALPVGDEYRGVGYLYGASDHTPTVRTYLADHGDAEKILKAARAHRERLGTLSGVAAGEESARQARDVLADVIKVWAYVGRAGVHWTRLAELLAEHMPEQYAGETGDSISALVRGEGVPSEQVKADGVNLQGCKRQHVESAIHRREITSR